MNKLFNKLTLAIAIAPAMATCCVSCTPTNYEEPFETKELDGTIITPPYDPSLEEWKNQGSATLDFINNCLKDPKNFTHEMFYATSLIYDDLVNVFSEEKDITYSLDECSFGFTDASFGKTKTWIMGFEDKEYDTISFQEKIHLKYSFSDESETWHATREIDANIEFNDVIFFLYESEMEPGPKTAPWKMGFIDETFGYEAFWSHQYNMQPWSITYGLSNKNVKTIKGAAGQPDVEIHNATYYSGNIDNAVKMYNLYTYLQSLRETTFKTSEEKLEEQMINCILNLNRLSYYTKDYINYPDLCIQTQLGGNIALTTEKQVPVVIHGIHLIKPYGENITINRVRLDLSKTIKTFDTSGLRAAILDPQDLQLYDASRNDYSFIINLRDYGSGRGFDKQETLFFPWSVIKLPTTIEYLHPKYGPRTITPSLSLHYNTYSIEVKPEN